MLSEVQAAVDLFRKSAAASCLLQARLWDPFAVVECLRRPEFQDGRAEAERLSLAALRFVERGRRPGKGPQSRTWR